MRLAFSCNWHIFTPFSVVLFPFIQGTSGLVEMIPRRSRSWESFFLITGEQIHRFIVCCLIRAYINSLGSLFLPDQFPDNLGRSHPFDVGNCLQHIVALLVGLNTHNFPIALGIIRGFRSIKPIPGHRNTLLLFLLVYNNVTRGPRFSNIFLIKKQKNVIISLYIPREPHPQGVRKDH